MKSCQGSGGVKIIRCRSFFFGGGADLWKTQQDFLNLNYGKSKGQIKYFYFGVFTTLVIGINCVKNKTIISFCKNVMVWSTFRLEY